MASKRVFGRLSPLLILASLVACGLSITGIGPEEATRDAGLDAGEDVVVAPVDARAPPDCPIALECADGDDRGTCLLESCEETGEQFTTVSNGSVRREAGVCVVRTKGNELALFEPSARVPDHYRFRFDTEVASNLFGGLVRLGPSDAGAATSSVFVILANGQMGLCHTRPGATDGGSTCPAIEAGLPEAGGYVRLSGEVDRRAGRATVQVGFADSPESCAKVVEAEVGGTYEDRISFTFGCSKECTSAFKKARFEVEPLP
jgi:hypothetical protein